MKAILYHGNKDLRLDDVPEPMTPPGEAKIRIDYCGICATDIEEYLYGPKFLDSSKMPIITGHEMTGTVVELGDGVTTIATGDRVVINSILTCGKCDWCRRGETQQCASKQIIGFDRNGGLAEYTTWPALEIIRLADHVTSESAALTEPSAVAHHAVTRGRIQGGDTVAVVGAGTVGILAMQIAKSYGARVFAIDRRDMSLSMAAELGADETINSETSNPGETLKSLTDGKGPDVVIDAAGATGTPELAIKSVRNGGRVVLVAIYISVPEFDFNNIVVSEVEVIGSLAFTRRDVEAVVELMAKGTLRTTPLITDRITIDEVIDSGFARMTAPTKDVFRIVVSPSS